MFSAVVFGAGRTGSHLIARNLGRHFKSNVIPTHNPLLNLPTPDAVPVISKRASTFDALISMFVASEVNRFHWNAIDSHISIEPFSIDGQKFADMFVFQTAFYQVIESRRFANSVEIVYKDMLADPKYLFSKFGVNCDIQNLLTKSPYDASSLVSNIEQCRDWYSSLSATGITSQQYDFFIQKV